MRVSLHRSRIAVGRRPQAVADRVRKLFVDVRDANRDVFDEYERITAGDREIATVVAELQDFRFVPDEDPAEVYDVVGSIRGLCRIVSEGRQRPVFTHRLIVNLLVRLVDPDERDVIFDPAMGSGGFLISAMRHFTQKIMRSSRQSRAKRAAVANFHSRIFGIDKSPKLVKVARTNMILASDGHAGLVKGDTLDPPERLPQDFLRRAGIGVASVILTNPPFGATVEHKITDPDILSQFDLGKAWKRIDGTYKATDVLTGEGAPPEYLFV